MIRRIENLPLFLPTLATWAMCVLLAGCGVFAPATGNLPDDCDAVTDLFAVADLAAAVDHPCRGWVESSHGRVARSGTGSAVVVSNQTTFGAGILVSATHVLGAGWFGLEGVEIDAAVRDPSEQMGVARIELIGENGFASSGSLSPMFDFFNAPIPDEENTIGLFDILPRHDFFFATIDGQTLERGLIAQLPDPLAPTSPMVFDPLMLIDAQPPIGDVCPGDLVLMIGYASGSFNRALAASVGRVLSDDEANAIIMDLAAAGDVEGDIPYENDVEMVIEGEALSGMSGGGIFDASGILVGVLVRASDPINNTRYVRSVRMTYAARQVADAIDALAPDQREVIEQFWDTSMSSVIDAVCPSQTVNAD